MIAAGAHSRYLAVFAGDSVQLDTERGYHVEFNMANLRVAPPVCPAAQGFYLCPMRGRLRVAGMVELGDLAAPANLRLLHALAANARRVFLEVGAPSRTSLRFRPSMPDSVPVIRLSKEGRDSALPHVTTTIGPIERGLPIDLVFQSIAGTEAANRSFGIDLSILKEGRETALSLKRRARSARM
jgi:hypothetical protein